MHRRGTKRTPGCCSKTGPPAAAWPLLLSSSSSFQVRPSPSLRSLTPSPSKDPHSPHKRLSRVDDPDKRSLPAQTTRELHKRPPQPRLFSSRLSQPACQQQRMAPPNTTSHAAPLGTYWLTGSGAPTLRLFFVAKQPTTYVNIHPVCCPGQAAYFFLCHRPDVNSSIRGWPNRALP